MTFDEALDQALALIRRRGRTSLRALKRQLDVDEAFLEDLRYELVEVLGAAREEDPGVLVALDLDSGADATGARAGEAGPADPATGARAAAQRPMDTASGAARPAGVNASPVREGWGRASGASGSTEPDREEDQSEPPSRPPAPFAERRQLTVMFCDLVDSTRLSERLDPEDLRELIRSYQQVAAQEVQRYDGYVAQYLGDGILVYFGFPRAHEDDARRSVHAALALIAALDRGNEDWADRLNVHLAVRIGIHTGLVVVGEVGGGSRREQLALGETPNIAARLQGLAAPGEVVISGSTLRLLGGGFDTDDLGPRQVKGIHEPIAVHRVMGERSRPSSTILELSSSPGLFGRERELAMISEAWARTQGSHGEVLLLSGEAGIGKSSLLHALRERVARERGAQVVFRCSAYHTNSALHPVLERLAQRLDLTREDTGDVRLAKLEHELERAGVAPSEGVPLLAPLLSIPTTSRYPEPTFGPELRRVRTREVLLRWILYPSGKLPMLVVWEDLHWADPSTIDLIEALVARVEASRALVLVSYRPEFASPWAAGPGRTVVLLARLDRAAIEGLVRRLADGRALPLEIIDEIARKTDGVPLFVEEVTKLLLESELLVERQGVLVMDGPLPELAVPTTLRDSLMARLDRLSEARELAQLGSVVGREFSRELILSISRLSERRLNAALERLVDAELVLRRGNGPEEVYIFKHALIQDVAYSSLLKSARVVSHLRIAKVFEERFPETVERSPELLAHHLSRAGETERAIDYWRRAGELAYARSGHTEAINHFRTALSQLELLPETSARRVREIRLQIRVGAPLTATRGYGAPEVEAAYTRARELAEQHGEGDDLFQALYGLWRVNMLRAEYARSAEMAERVLAIAEESGNPSLKIAAHRARGAVRFYQGRFADCLADMARVSELAAGTGDGSRPMLDVYDVVDPRVTGGTYSAWALWMQGHTEEAQRSCDEAVHLAEELDHPFSRALAMSFATWLAQFRGDVARTLELSEASIAYSREQGFPFWLGWGEVLRGWAIGKQGGLDEAVETIEAGLALWHEKGSELGRSYFYCMLAEIQDLRGDTDAAFDAVAHARKFAKRTGERYWKAERMRFDGELRLRTGRGDPDEAAALVQRALEVAREQGAGALEQRALESLAAREA